MRNGAPFHGAKGDGKIATSAAASQAPDRFWAPAGAAGNSNPTNTPTIGNEAVMAATNRRARIN
jgi:hypothetical protein